MLSLAHTILCVLLIGTSVPSMDAVPFSTCKGSGKLVEVQISDCSSPPCTFKRGEYVTIKMEFIPNSGTDIVTTGAVASIGSIKIPLRDVNGTPACGYIFLKETGKDVGCNLVAGQVYTYTYVLEVLSRFPVGYVQIQWELVEKTRQTIVCSQVPVHIV